jgi:diadenylate cyclase
VWLSEAVRQWPALGVRDGIEIAVVAYVLYRILLLIRGTRTVHMLIGVVILVVAYAVAWVTHLTMITYLLGLVFTYGVFAAVVIFQPELRQGLAHLGQARVTRLIRRMGVNEVADEIADAVDRLSRAGIGAIIAIEREMGLGEYIESGSALEAKVSADLLTTIFTPYSPLHDGAVIIRGDTVIGAACILPLSQLPIADRSLGTRHRAALGLAEETDALVIIVSEETAVVSLAADGQLDRGLTATQVRDILSGRAPRVTAERLAAGGVPTPTGIRS